MQLFYNYVTADIVSLINNFSSMVSLGK